MPIGTTVALMPSIRDCGPQFVLTVDKELLDEGR